MTAARKPGIPSVTGIKDTSTSSVVSALKQNVETMTGARNGLGPLPFLSGPAVDLPTATAVNGIITRLNASGAVGPLLKQNTVSPFTGGGLVSLTSGVSGILPIANGGTNSSVGPNLRGSFITYLSANQTGCTSSAYNKLKYNTVVQDVEGWYDNVTNFRYTPLVPGTYFFYGTAVSATIAAGDGPQIVLYKNGVRFADGTYNPTPLVSSAWCGLASAVTCNGSTDYIEVFCYIPATVTVINANTSTTTRFGGFRISA